MISDASKRHFVADYRVYREWLQRRYPPTSLIPGGHTADQWAADHQRLDELAAQLANVHRMETRKRIT